MSRNLSRDVDFNKRTSLKDITSNINNIPLGEGNEDTERSNTNSNNTNTNTNKYKSNLQNSSKTSNVSKMDHTEHNSYHIDVHSTYTTDRTEQSNIRNKSNSRNKKVIDSNCSEFLNGVKNVKVYIQGSDNQESKTK